MTQKEKAIEILKQMDIYKPYIERFKEKDYICFFESYGGYWAYQNEELSAKIKEIEQKYGCLVYAVILLSAKIQN